VAVFTTPVSVVAVTVAVNAALLAQAEVASRISKDIARIMRCDMLVVRGIDVSF